MSEVRPTMTRKPTIDPRAVARLYDSELHAIGEMLTAVGVPENDDAGYPISDRLRVRVFIDQHLELRAEAERLRAALQDIADGDVPPAGEGVNQYLSDDLIHHAKVALRHAQP